MDTHEIAFHLEKSTRLQRPRSRQRPPTLAQLLLHRTGALLPAGSQSVGNHQSPIWSKLLTREPDAGDPQVRFGGGSETNQCLVPTSIVGESPTGRIRRLTTERDVRKEAARLNLQAGHLLNQQAITKVNFI